jgi:murein DD-endopeptidase MepM/ murein hydrolase activator NlpD
VALQATARARIRVLLIVALLVTGLAVLFWRLDRRSASGPPPISSNRAEEVATPSASETPLPSASLMSPDVATPVGSIAPVPDAPGAERSPAPANSPPNDLAHIGGITFTPRLVIPVLGVKPDQLLDTFTDARSEGRMHDAIDIPAPAGTPVIAAADGEIVKLFQSDRGGTTIYQLSTDKKLVFYYAHLQRYADSLVVGKFVKQGEVIGYVGDTGNAGAGNYHLHFSISIIADPKRYWEGTNINPYPLLHK